MSAFDRKSTFKQKQYRIKIKNSNKPIQNQYFLPDSDIGPTSLAVPTVLTTEQELVTCTCADTLWTNEGLLKLHNVVHIVTTRP
jgi:hypothetical protein